MTSADDDKSKLRRLQQLRQHAERNPENPDKWMDYARFLALESMNPQELILAIKHLEKLLPAVDFRRKLGHAYIANGDLERGIALVKVSVTESPDAKGFVHLASICCNNEFYREAQEACREAIRYDPEFAEAYYLMGDATETFSREDAALWYRKAIQLDPQYELAWQKLGKQLISKAETCEEGVDALRKAMQLDPEDGWACLYLANGLWRLRRMEDAKKEYKRATKIFPDYWFVHKWYGEFLERLGEEEEASKEFELAESLRVLSEAGDENLA